MTCPPWLLITRHPHFGWHAYLVLPSVLLIVFLSCTKNLWKGSRGRRQWLYSCILHRRTQWKKILHQMKPRCARGCKHARRALEGVPQQVRSVFNPSNKQTASFQSSVTIVKGSWMWMKAASTFYSEVDPTHAAISDWCYVKTCLRRGPGTMLNKLAMMR